MSRSEIPDFSPVAAPLSPQATSTEENDLPQAPDFEVDTSAPARSQASPTNTSKGRIPSPSPRALELSRKIEQLRSTISHTEAELQQTLQKLSALPSFQQQSSLSTPNRKTTSYPSSASVASLSPEQQRTLVQAQDVLDRHIKQLGKYNELKDIAMGMLGMIAEKEGKTLRAAMVARDVDDDE